MFWAPIITLAHALKYLDTIADLTRDCSMLTSKKLLLSDNEIWDLLRSESWNPVHAQVQVVPGSFALEPLEIEIQFLDIK
jgi:hypothetical protein